jgi:hypothetical protein
MRALSRRRRAARLPSRLLSTRSSHWFSSGREDAGSQAFGEASARDDGIHKTRRAHTRNSPIARAASRHRSQFAHRSAGDRSPDNAARVQEPQGSASRLSIASAWSARRPWPRPPVSRAGLRRRIPRIRSRLTCARCSPRRRQRTFRSAPTDVTPGVVALRVTAHLARFRSVCLCLAACAPLS